MADWIRDPQNRDEVEKVTKNLKLPVWKASYKGKFRDFWNECWGKIEDAYSNLKKLVDGKEPSFEKKSGFNKEKTDEYTEDDTNKVATGKALKKLYDWIRGKLASLTLSWDRITGKPNLMSSENVQALLRGKVDKNGDTMTGTLNIHNNNYSHINLHRGPYKGGIGALDNAVGIYNAAGNYSIELRDNKTVFIPSSNLKNKQDVVSAINYLADNYKELFNGASENVSVDTQGYKYFIVEIFYRSNITSTGIVINVTGEYAIGTSIGSSDNNWAIIEVANNSIKIKSKQQVTNIKRIVGVY